MKISNLLLLVGAFLIFAAMLTAAINLRVAIHEQSGDMGSLTGNRSSVEHASSIPLKHLEIIGPMKLILSAGMPSVIIEADEALQSQLQDKHEDPETLRLEVPKHLRAESLNIIARVSSPDLQSMQLDGDITVSSEGVLSFRENVLNCSGSTFLELDYSGADLIRVESSGSVSGRISGRTTRLDLDHSGSNHLDAETLKADSVFISFSGSCESNVYAEQFLSVEGSGSGHIRYAGRPQIESDFSGSASLRSL